MMQPYSDNNDLSSLSAKAMQLSSEGIIITDARANILNVNPAMCNITGYKRNQIIGSTPRIFKSGHHDETFYKHMWSDLTQHGEWQGEILDRKINGEVASRQLRIKSVRNSQGNTTHYIGLMRDNSQLAALTRLASKDPLTNLPNRRLFDERLGQAAIRSKRTGKAFALLYIDLDDFKKINDNWGHLIGDKILNIVAKRLKENTREEDTVARLGGDEFAVILPEVGSTANTRLVLDKIINRINKTCTIEKKIFNISCSIGYSLYPDHTGDTDQLLELADQNMYAQKKCRHIS